MMCPKCGNYNTYVIDSREEVGYRRRRYKCSDCDARWTTAEIPMERLTALKKRHAPLKEVRQAAECLNRFLERKEIKNLD